MIYPYGEQQYDSDGLPVSGSSRYQQQPFANPQAGYQQPMYGQPQYQGGPVQNYGGYQPMPYAAPKSWVVAAVLAFFLGSFGAHNFYLGYRNRGLTQLVLYLAGWVTAFIIIGLPVIFAVQIWAFIEFLMILVRGGKYATDANGLRLD